MKSILDHFVSLKQPEWDYYFGIEPCHILSNPFTGNMTYSDFIQNYFKRGGKIELLDTIDISVSDLRFPNHICSVFFLGILIYNRTNLHKKYNLGKNDPGYDSFSFIWFLITLFHDYSYSIENNSSKYSSIKSLSDLYSHFGVTEKLFDHSPNVEISPLLNLRKSYFDYRLKKCGKIDHGLLAGILMYDRLVKIRRAKKQKNEHTLFWGESLEEDYKTASDAISIHNIWMPNNLQHDLYKRFGLTKLVNFKPVCKRPQSSAVPD